MPAFHLVEPGDRSSILERGAHHLSLTLADSGGVSESIFHALPNMVRNFYTVSAWPGHERNLMMPDFGRTAAIASLKVKTAFGYHAVVLGLNFRDL